MDGEFPIKNKDRVKWSYIFFNSSFLIPEVKKEDERK